MGPTLSPSGCSRGTLDRQPDHGQPDHGHDHPGKLLGENHDLPPATGARLFYWSQDSLEVRRYGDFQIAFTMMGEPNTTVVRLHF